MHKTPAVEEDSFSCPHCGAYTHQYWNALGIKRVEKGKFPHVWTKENTQQIIDILGSEEAETEIENWNRILEIVSKRNFFTLPNNGDFYGYPLDNLYLSECFTCKEYAIWLKDKLLYPEKKFDVQPNEDLPAEIKADFNEARDIFHKSPRASAALLRLCIQKLCSELQVTGSINEQIKALVGRGLEPEIQQALDAVRVIGNSAVHPGEINIKDKPDIAETLFNLVNIIADAMITRPKKIKEIYSNLPAGALEAIERRDSKK